MNSYARIAVFRGTQNRKLIEIIIRRQSRHKAEVSEKPRDPRLICLTHALRRLPHLSRRQFLDHWRNINAPLVTALAQDLGIHRSIQLHPLDEHRLSALTPRPGEANDYDGFAQVWFLDETALLRARETENGRAALARVRRDEALFLAHKQSLSWWSEPHTIIA